MDSDASESGQDHERQGDEYEEYNSGEGAASAMEHMQTQMRQHRRVAGDSRSEAVLRDT
jgi:hypothetical protein